MNKGLFIMSLDFEGQWGSIGGHTDSQLYAFAERVRKNPVVIPRLRSLFDKYGIHCTWAVVGAMLCRDKEEVLSLLDKDVVYKSWGISIMDYIKGIKDNSLYFFPDLIDTVKNTSNQEIGSHTFTHFYANEAGVSVEMLQQEMELSRKVLSELGVEAKTLIMPRNQVEGLDEEVLNKTGFTIVRGRGNGPLKPKIVKKVVQFADAYLPLVKRTYPIDIICNGERNNVKASILFRPYLKKLGFMEPLKLWRIKLAMKKAAERGECFHLWFHPHNVANNMDRNFATLESVFKYYNHLNKKYGFRSVTMSECAALAKSE